MNNDMAGETKSALEILEKIKGFFIKPHIKIGQIANAYVENITLDNYGTNIEAFEGNVWGFL